ncbi:MAG: cytochrome c biogenesis protein CcdA [Dehalococcoidia bacterium]|nr:cytochrome c biogenesis protein CcdA [Dehalococcoidia bacterium]
MVNRRAIVAVSFPIVLVLAVGLAAGVWETPARLYSGAPEALTSTGATLSTVIIAGLLDGINPCAFTVLLLFVATMASMYRNVEGPARRTVRARLLLFGGVFIFAIFLTYLSLGAGLLQASTALTQNHVGARIGALASVLMGLWMIKDYLLPGWGLPLRAPALVGRLVSDWGQRATFMSMAGLGVLVGLCTVPCSGAVYLAVLSMLALQKSFALSYMYLVLYNVMFVVPLLGILAVASARPSMNRLAHWNTRHKEWVRLGLGIGVVALGLAILATV